MPCQHFGGGFYLFAFSGGVFWATFEVAKGGVPLLDTAFWMAPFQESITWAEPFSAVLLA